MNERCKRLVAAGAAGVSMSLAACSGSEGTSPAAPAGASRAEGRYTDGTYRARGRYGSLPSSIDVSVELDGGRITAVDVTPRATDPTSLELQERFAEAVPAVVVVRPIDEVRVSRLAGSSGTPVGFNDALRRIRSQASR